MIDRSVKINTSQVNLEGHAIPYVRAHMLTNISLTDNGNIRSHITHVLACLHTFYLCVMLMSCSCIACTRILVYACPSHLHHIASPCMWCPYVCDMYICDVLAYTYVMLRTYDCTCTLSWCMCGCAYSCVMLMSCAYPHTHTHTLSSCICLDGIT